MGNTLGVSQGPPLEGLWGAISTPLALRGAGAVQLGPRQNARTQRMCTFRTLLLGSPRAPLWEAAGAPFPRPWRCVTLVPCSLGMRCVWVCDVCGFVLRVGMRCVRVCDACGYAKCE